MSNKKHSFLKMTTKTLLFAYQYIFYNGNVHYTNICGLRILSWNFIKNEKMYQLFENENRIDKKFYLITNANIRISTLFTRKDIHQTNNVIIKIRFPFKDVQFRIPQTTI